MEYPYLGKGASSRVKLAIGYDTTTKKNILYALKVELPRLSDIFTYSTSSDGSYRSLESYLLWENNLWPSGGRKLLRKTNSHGNRRYTLMYYQGETLEAFLRSRQAKNEPLSTDIALDIAIKICICLHRMHTGHLQSANLYAHLDLKPSNITITMDAEGNPNLSLIDYGFSRTYKLNKTSELPFQGTPRYMPFDGPYEKNGKIQRIITALVPLSLHFCWAKKSS